MSAEPIVIPEPPEALTLEQIQELQRNHRRLEYWLQPEEALRLHAIAAADPACPIAEATTVAIDQLKRSSP